MAGLNKATLIGYLGRDAEMRYTTGGTAFARFSLATTETWTKDGEKQERTEWHRITLWGKIAESLNEHLTKGTLVYVEGPIQTRKWDDKEGVTRYTTEINARTIQLLSKKRSGGTTNREAEPEPELTEDDIPF